MPRLISGVVITVIVSSICINGIAQTPQDPMINVGLPQTVFDGTNIDHVDLMNGSLVVNIPLVSLPGRGMTTQVILSTTSKQWDTSEQLDAFGNAYFSYNYGVVYAGNPTNGWHIGVPKMGQAAPTDYCESSDADADCIDGYLQTVNFVRNDGTTSTLLGVNGRIECPNATCNYVARTDAWSVDGSYLYYDAADGAVVYPDGTRAWSDKLVDRNGNQIIANSSGWIDTIGRQITDTKDIANQTETVQYPNSSGDVSTIVIQYQTFNVRYPVLVPNTFSGCAVGDPSCYYYPGFSVPQHDQAGDPLGLGLPISITLPGNSGIYHFDYIMNSDGTTTGEISHIYYPTGGYVRYTYGYSDAIEADTNGMDDPASGTGDMAAVGANRVVRARYVSPTGLPQDEQPWTYEYDSNNARTIVTDPFGTKSIDNWEYSQSFVFAPAYGSDFYEVPTPFITSSSITDQAGNLLSSTQNIYIADEQLYNFKDNGQSSQLDNFLPQSVTTTIPASGMKSQINYLRDPYGNATTTQYSDWGSGTPGSILKTVTSNFLPDTNTTYASGAIHILNDPTTTTISGPGCTLSGGICSVVNTSYDQYSSVPNGSGLISTSSSAVGEDYTDYAQKTSRGNVTSVTRGSGSASTTEYYAYNDLGEVVNYWDPKNNLHSYHYTDNFAVAPQISGSTLAFLTEIDAPGTNGISHTKRYQYYYNEGKLAASCGENYPQSSSCAINAQLPQPDYTMYTFDEASRLTSATNGDSGFVHLAYPDVNHVEMQNAIGLDEVATYDGLGRQIGTKISSISPNIQVDTQYDVLGRKISQSNPYYAGETSATDGATTYKYDGLNRETQVINQDQTATSFCYDGQATSGQQFCQVNHSDIAAASWVDSQDEVGNLKQSASDALGNVKAIMEQDANSGSMIPSVETAYNYDAASNLLGVDQHGAPGETARTRSFSYDALSRLVTAQNPETGEVTYGYLVNGTACSGDPTLPCSKTDARNAVTNYSYDALNRITAKTYTGIATPSISYTYDTSSVSGATATVGRLTSETVTSGSTLLSQRQPYAYDPAGHVEELLECSPANCLADPYHLSYRYDLAGNVIQSTNGIPNAAFTGVPSNLTTQFGNATATFNGISVPSVLLSMGYDSDSRALSLHSSWADSGNHPDMLFQVASTNGYSPVGLASATLGLNSQTSALVANLNRTYDNRLRLLSEADTTTSGVVYPATVSVGTITISGSEQSINHPGNPATGSITIGGFERTPPGCGVQIVISGTSAGPPVKLPPPTQCVYPAGSVIVTIDGFTASAGFGGGSTASTSATVAASLARALNLSGSPVVATSSGSVVTMTSIATGTTANYPFTVSESGSVGFTGIASGATLTGGTAGPPPTYDTGTVSVNVNGAVASVSWGDSDTSATIAANIAAALGNTNGFSVVASGPSVVLRSTATGSSTNWSVSASVSDTAGFASPSFSTATTDMSGGTDSTSGPAILYGYSIPQTDGFTPNGNIRTVTDSVTGRWSYGYDSLDRLIGAVVDSGTYQNVDVSGVTMRWAYDSFGNRLTQNSNYSLFPTGSVQFAGADNRASGIGLASAPTVSQDTLQYDNSGNLTGKDGNTNTAYDAEGRICAVVNSNGGYTGYIYDAEGNRVAKGTVNALSCDVASNGFSATSSYVMGRGGTQLTEFDLVGGQWSWAHSNIYAGSSLVATYHDTNTYFALNDWLGTKRVEATPDGLVTSYDSLPYGDGLISSGGLPDATENHFTGKEHDSESGLDYFGARYLSSNMGRWMSPDWSVKVEPVPYVKEADPQSLNLYSYVRNNPVGRVDSDGHQESIYNYAVGNIWIGVGPGQSPDGTDSNGKVRGYTQQQYQEFLHSDGPGKGQDQQHSFLPVVHAQEEEGPDEAAEEAARPPEIEPSENTPSGCNGCFRPGHGGPLRDQDARNFEYYRADKLDKPMTVYRAWGGTAHLEGRDGTYYSVLPPEGSAEANRQLYSILPEWGNTLSNTTRVTIPAGTTVYMGPAAPQTSEGGVTYPGGGLQVFVPR